MSLNPTKRSRVSWLLPELSKIDRLAPVWSRLAEKIAPAGEPADFSPQGFGSLAVSHWG